jgi:hypothetical protein
MKKKHVIVLAIVAVSFGFGFITSWCVLRQRARTSLETSLDNRERVLTLLNRNFAEAPEGTTPAGRRPKPTHVLFPGREHIRGVLRRQRWHSVRSFETGVYLSESYIARHDQNSSETCTARKLLDYYCRDLGRLGLGNQGWPWSRRPGSTQYAAQVWWVEDYTIHVLANVVVDLDSKTAVIQCNVIEDY